jgi:hypothetical protein
MITGSSAVDTTDNRQLQGWNSNCNTLAFWHPVYTGDWSGGFCSLQITCNSPSYNSAAECCNTNFPGQIANTCYTTAGIPIPTSAPVLPSCNTLALWHPVYTGDWSGGFCSLQITCNSPSYNSAAECCNTNFASQSSNTCYTTAGIPLPTAFPTTSNPTETTTSKPTTDKPTSKPTTTKPTSKPTSTHPTSKP